MGQRLWGLSGLDDFVNLRFPFPLKTDLVEDDWGDKADESEGKSGDEEDEAEEEEDGKDEDEEDEDED